MDKNHLHLLIYNNGDKEVQDKRAYFTPHSDWPTDEVPLKDLSDTDINNLKQNLHDDKKIAQVLTKIDPQVSIKLKGNKSQ